MLPYFLYSETTQRNQPGELEVVQNIFGSENTGFLITEIPENRVVIPRFRAIPFGKELEKEIINQGSVLINSYREHSNIANVFYWASLLEGLTAPAYHDWEMPYLPEGKWFVKGATNSIKNRWFECCYAPDKKTLPEIVRNNQLDVYVGTQEIVIRPYQNFRVIGEAVDRRPIFNERRCFVVNGKLVSSADYWSSYPELKEPALNESKFIETVEKTLNLIGDIAPFFVVDLAEHDDGNWSVVEANDGCMSGLSDNDPDVVWQAVYDYVCNFNI